MDGATTAITMTSVISGITEIVEAGVQWVGSAADVVAGNPLLLFGVLVPFVGIGIGLLKRLLPH